MVEEDVLNFFSFLDQNLLWISSILVVFLKFFIAFAFYAINLHTLETFPTCVRQTGAGFCVISASGFGAIAPYIIYLVIIDY